MSKIRIGIIGAGTNTREKHIPGFQAIPDVEIVTVCNRSEESSQKVADEFGIPRISTTWQDVVNDPEVDAICIGTWPYLHGAITIAALKAGKHVLTEARMAKNLSDAELMLEASRDNPHLVAQIVPSPFTFAYDKTVMDMLEGGVLGDLREVRVIHAGGQCADSSKPLTWRQNIEYSGYNILTMGIFHEVILRWFGKNPRWIVADGMVHTEKRFDPETGETVEVKIPEAITVTGRFNKHSRLHYYFSGVSSGKSEMEIRLDGSKGSLRLDLLTQKLYFASAGSPDEQEVKISDSKRGSWQVEEDFIASIRDGKKVTLTDFETGVEYMRFTEGVFQSIEHHALRVAIR